MSIIGLAINGFAKNVAQEIAIDSARYGALADQDAFSARIYAQNLLSNPIFRLFRSEVTTSKGSTATICKVQVAVSLKTVGFGLFSTVLRVEEKSSALCEIQE